MLAESKDTAGLMVDLAYGAVYFDDSDLADVVDNLWDDLRDLCHQMRVVAVVAARTRWEAEAMATLLLVIGAIEDLGRDAVDIAHIAAASPGAPAGLVDAFADSEPLLSRVVIGAGSALAGATLSSARLPFETGNRVLAVRSRGVWNTDIDGATTIEADDLVVLVGPQSGAIQVGKMAGVDTTTANDPSKADDATNVGPAVNIVVEMKTLAEVAVGLAYAVLLTDDSGLADEVDALAHRLDQLKDHMHAQVLATALTEGNAPGLTLLLLLAQAVEDLGDRAADMARPVSQRSRVHPVLVLALGESVEVTERVVVSSGSAANGMSVHDTTVGTGFEILAIERDRAYQYRPSSAATLLADDVLIATGPSDGRIEFLARCK